MSGRLLPSQRPPSHARAPPTRGAPSASAAAFSVAGVTDAARGAIGGATDGRRPAGAAPPPPSAALLVIVAGCNGDAVGARGQREPGEAAIAAEECACLPLGGDAPSLLWT